MGDDLNFWKMDEQPQFFGKGIRPYLFGIMKDDICFFLKEDDLNFWEMEDDLYFFVEGRQPHFLMENQSQAIGIV